MPTPKARIWPSRPVLTAELQEAVQTKSPELARRARAVLLIADGKSVEEVASQLGTSSRTVRRYVARYNCGLMEALFYESPCPNMGRPPKTVSEEAIRAALSPRRRAEGRWTIKELAERLQCMGEPPMSLRTLARRLKKLEIDLRVVGAPPPMSAEEAGFRVRYAKLEKSMLSKERRQFGALIGIFPR